MELLDEQDQHGLRPIDLASNDETRSECERLLVGVGQYKLSDFLDSLHPSGVSNLEEIAERFSMDEDDLAGLIRQEPGTLYRLAQSFEPEKYEKAIWAVEKANLDVHTPLSELVDFNGYSWDLRSVASEAFDSLCPTCNGRLAATRDWTSACQDDSEILAVLMGGHARLGAHSPLGSLPHNLLKRIAILGVDHSKRFKNLGWMAQAQGEYCGEEGDFTRTNFNSDGSSVLHLESYLTSLGATRASEVTRVFNLEKSEVSGFLKWLVANLVEAACLLKRKACVMMTKNTGINWLST